jgi:hypothetical protein
MIQHNDSKFMPELIVTPREVGTTNTCSVKLTEEESNPSPMVLNAQPYFYDGEHFSHRISMNSNP